MYKVSGFVMGALCSFSVLVLAGDAYGQSEKMKHWRTQEMAPETFFPEGYYFKHPSAKGTPVEDEKHVYSYRKPWALDHDTPGYDSIRQVLDWNKDWIVWWQDSLKKVPRFARGDVRDRELPGTDFVEKNTVRLRAVRGEKESFQVAVYRRYKNPITVNRVEMSDLSGAGGASISAERVRLYQVGYLNRTKPDPLYPLGDGTPRWSEHTGAFENLHFWVTVDVPREASPGVYEATLDLSIEGETVDVPIRVDVSPVTLPGIATFQNQKFQAGGLSALKWAYPDRDPVKVMKEEVFPLLADARIPYGQPWPPGEFRRQGVDPHSDEGVRLFRKWMNYWEEHELRAPYLRSVFPRNPLSNPEQAKAAIDRYLPILRKQGWLDQTFVRLPGDENPEATESIEAAEFWAKHAPELQTHMTISSFPEKGGGQEMIDKLEDGYGRLAKNVDIIAINANSYKVNNPGTESWFQKRHEAGLETSWYIHQYMSVGEPAMWLRTYFWRAFQDGVRMSTWWTLMQWDSGWGSTRERTIWRERRGFGRPRTAGAPTGNTLGFYPGEDGVLSGIRFELIRDGVEEYDLLTKLADRVAELNDSDVDEALLDEARNVLDVPDRLMIQPKPYPLNAIREEPEFNPHLKWRMEFADYRHHVIEVLERLRQETNNHSTKK